MARSVKPPSYRCRTIRGRKIAYVTFVDSLTKVRRDFWLGPYGSDESRERYVRLLAEWESRGRRLLESPKRVPVGIGPTVTQICYEFWKAIQGQYSRSEIHTFGMAMRVLRQYYGTTPASEFGPNALRIVRQGMISGDPTTDPPRIPWARRAINRQMARIRFLFKWAVSRELLPVTVHQALCTVEPLRRGRGEVRETAPVRPVAESDVHAIRPHVNRQVRAMVDLQLLTGMRPGEVCGMRPCDLEMSGRVWLYRPPEHKTAYRGHERKILLGPRAQKVIEPFLTGRATDAPLFSPAEAEAERRAELHADRVTPLSCGNRPGTNRKEQPQRRPGNRYTVDSYRRAIAVACEKAWPMPDNLSEDERAAWRRTHHWHPHQLRHTYATTVRRQYGLEAAQILLGHSSALITDAVYAERDLSKALRVAAKLG